jgi:hypothetical protein
MTTRLPTPLAGSMWRNPRRSCLTGFWPYRIPRLFVCGGEGLYVTYLGGRPPKLPTATLKAVLRVPTYATNAWSHAKAFITPGKSKNGFAGHVSVSLETERRVREGGQN